jgi:hemerythrin-like domain-containing protein
MKPTHALREHHDELVRKVQDFEQVLDSLPRISAANLSEVVARQVDFLQNEIKNHAAAEEVSLYPEVDFLACSHGCKISSTMKIDHEYLGTYIDRLAEVAEQLDPGRVPEFQRLGWELVAILKLHFDKEERVFLPLIDAGYTEEEVERRIVKRMEKIEGKQDVEAIRGQSAGYDYV